MKQKTAEKLMNEFDKMFDTLPIEELSPWNFFVNVNNIVSKYKGLDCLININFANGGVTQGICLITDWQPGALVFQSDDGYIPKLRLVFPEEYVEFMKQLEPVLNVQYPEFPEDQA